MDVNTNTTILPHPDAKSPTSVMDPLPPIAEDPPTRTPPTPTRTLNLECPVLPPFPAWAPPPPAPQILDLSIALLSAFALGSLTAGAVVWSFSKRSTTCT